MWEIVDTDIFSVDIQTLLRIVDYYSKFPVMKSVEELSAGDLIRAMKVMHTKVGLPKKV